MWKTVSARIRGADTELQELGEETDEYVQSTSKLQAKIKGLTGVDIMKDKDTYKDIYTIVVEIGKVWNSLSDIDRASLLETMAGKLQSNRLAAVFSNVQELQEAYKSALNAEGSAEKEQENYAKSIEYSIGKAKASLQELAADAIDDSTIKSAVEGFNELVVLLDKVIDKFGIILPIAIAFSSYMSLKGEDTRKNILSDITSGQGVYYFGGKKKLAGLQTQRDSYTSKIENIENTLNGNDSSKLSSAEITKLNGDLTQAKDNLVKVDEQIAKTKTGFTALGSVVKNIGISIAISAAIKLIESFITVQSRLSEKVQAAAESYRNQASAMDELSTEVNKQYEILNDSNSSYEQQVEARKALYDIQGKLVDTYGAEASSISLVTDNIDAQEDALLRLNAAKKNALSLKYGEMLGEINSHGGVFDAISDMFANDMVGASTNADRVMKQWEKYVLTVPTLSVFNTDSETRDNWNTQVNDLASKYNVRYDQFAKTATGNVEDVQAFIAELQTLADDLDLSNIISQLGVASQKADAFYSQYKEFQDLFVENKYFTNNSDNENWKANYEKAVNAYEDALVKTDEDAIVDSQKAILKLLNEDVYQNLSDEAKRWVADLYPALENEISKWQFEIEFKAKDGTEIDENEFSNHAKAFSTTDELTQAMNGNMPNMTSAQQNAVDYYNGLGVATEDITQKLQSTGALNSKLTNDFKSQAQSLEGDYNKLIELSKDWSDDQKSNTIDLIKRYKSVDDVLKALNESAKEAKETMTSGDWADSLSGMDDAFSKLNAIYDDVKNGGTFDLSSFADAKDAFSNVADEFNAFKDVIASTPNDIASCQSAFDDLLSAYVTDKIGAQELTEENVKLVESYLEQQGVLNATQVAHKMLALTEAENASAATDVATTTEKVNAVMELSKIAAELERDGVNDDASAYKAYAAQKLASIITLLTSDQILQLASEAEQLGISKQAWLDYYNAKKGIETSSTPTSTSIKDTFNSRGLAGLNGLDDPLKIGAEKQRKKHQEQQQKKAEDNLRKELEEKEKKYKELPINTGGSYAGGSSTGGRGGGGGSSRDNSVTIDQTWDDRAISKAEKAYNEFVEKRDDTVKSYSERLGTYEEANRKQFEETYKEFEKLTDEYNNLVNGNLNISDYTPTWDETDQRYKTLLGEKTEVVENGEKTFTIQIATVLPDGTELTPEQAEEYIKTLSTNGSEDLLKSDTKKLIIQYTEGNQPDAFTGEPGTVVTDNQKYLRDLKYGDYKKQKDEVDSLIESLDNLLNKYKEQKALYEKVWEESQKDVKDQFGEEKAAKFVELVKEGSVDSSEWHTLIKDATQEQKEALDNLISRYDKYQDILDKIKEAEKKKHEDLMKQYETELEAIKAQQSVYQAQQDILESQIDLKEATGKLITAGDYGALINNANKLASSYEKQLSTLREQLDCAEDGSAEYYDIKSEILGVENNLIKVQEQQAKWNEEIRNIPINLIDQYLARLKAIQSLVEGYMSLQTTYGKVNTADEYKEVFKIASDNVKYAIEQQKLLKDKLGNYQWGSTKYNETASQIETINSDLSSIIEQMVEWNKEILNIPINKITAVNDQLNLVITAMTDIESEYEQVINAVTASIDKQIADIEKEQQEYADATQDRIDDIQKLIDALEREHEARQKLLDIEDAQFELEKARNQKTVATIQNGKLTYEADQESIREKQQQLDEQEFNYRIYQLQQQIQQLEDEKEEKDKAYQDEIDNLQKISDKWSEIASNIDLAKNQLKATEYLGEGWLNKVLTGDDAEIYNQFKTLYETMDKDLTQYQQQVASNERIATLMQQFVSQYESGAITYERALNGINGLVTALNTGLGVNDALSSYKELFSGNKITSLSDVLSQLQNSAQSEANNFSKYLEMYKQNDEAISKYTSTWEDLKKSVDEQIKALKAAYEAALAAASAMAYYSSSGNGGGGGGGGSGTIAIAGKNYAVDPNTGNVTFFNGSSGGKVNVSNGRYTGSSSSSSSKPNVIRAPSNKTYKRHDGIERGAIESTSDDKKASIIQAMALRPIKPDEMPQLLKQGEVVLTQGQQAQLLKNVNSLAGIQRVASGTNVTLNMSNLTFNEVNNGQDFANFITKNLANAVSQSMAKH